MTIAPTQAMLPELEQPSDPDIRWFAPHACVVRREDGRRDVFVGGTLVGSYGSRETGQRNVLLVTLAGNEDAHLERLSSAFGISSQTLRMIRRAYEQGGVAAIWNRHWGGSHPKVTERVRARLERMFAEGMTARQAQRKQRGAGAKVSLRTVRRERARWLAAQRMEKTSAASATPPIQQQQLELDVEAQSEGSADGAASGPAVRSGSSAASDSEHEHEAAERGGVDSEAATRGSEEESAGASSTITATAPSSASVVQHVGTWVMVATLHAMGLYERAIGLAEERVDHDALRVAIDAVVMALTIDQRCVEGVRRLATPSGPELLRSSRAPSASWVRKVLGQFSRDLGGARLHLGMAGMYVRDVAEQAAGAPVVFYVDNHLRPYTGKQVLRKGWRMQDKHVVPGSSDYYVHDVDGRPVLRVDAPHHGSLTEHLGPIARLLRAALGPDERILLAFDRAGSYPESMASLREEGFELVTYERRPYALLAETEFGKPFMLDDEPVRVAEASQKNLRGGRGRVRRIAIRHADSHQVNLLAVSKQSAEWLVRVMAGRWNQENGFKHGNERWGINQLDGRRVLPYSPDTVIPNPARRRLEHARRIARAREGNARLELARLAEGHPRRARLESDIAEAMAQQHDLEAQRPSTPARAPLKDTELSERLVHHSAEYKVTIDTLRIACANAEADLATELAPLLIRPREAKKALANLFAAPGRVRVTDDTITVTLLPAGTSNELHAFDTLLAGLDARRLSLPGDVRRRALRFRTNT